MGWEAASSRTPAPLASSTQALGLVKGRAGKNYRHPIVVKAPIFHAFSLDDLANKSFELTFSLDCSAEDRWLLVVESKLFVGGAPFFASARKRAAGS